MIPTTLITAVRAGLLALLLGLAAALTAPVARGAEVRHGDVSLSASPCLASVAAPLAEEWSWREFVKYWHRRTIGRTVGIVGIVLLVAAGAVLLILSKSK